MPLSQELKDRVVRDYFPRYATKRAALMPTLWLAQTEQGWLSSETFAEIGELLDLDATDVAAVASFYTMFNRHPVGETIFDVCENPPCVLNGARETMDQICSRYGVVAGHGHGGVTTPDGKVTIRPAECLAACDYAPVVQVNYRYHGPVPPEQVEAFLANQEPYYLEGPGGTPRYGTHDPATRKGAQ
jgi:NADH-quinone oxidoreductase subunit E